MVLNTPYKDVLPGLSRVERSTLEADIRNNGVQVPIVIDEEGNILDGHNRYEIDPDAPTRVVEGLGEAEKVAYVIRANLNRRNLSPDQTWELRETQKSLAAELKDQEWTQQEIAELLGVTQQCVAKWLDINNTTGCKTDKRDARVKLSNDAKPEVKRRLSDGETQSEIAKDYKVSQATISGVAKELATLNELRDRVAESLTDDKLRDQWEVFFYGPDKFDIKKAQAKRIELELEQARLSGVSAPETPAGVMLADPPWQYEFSKSDSRQIENQYPTATAEEIGAHLSQPWVPPIAKDCVLFMWATAPKLLEAFVVLDGWGFTYKTHAVWDKGRVGMGYWFRSQHELLLVATRGKPSPPAESQRVSSIFAERRDGKHSRKPECVYEFIESAFPTETKFEMYQRRRRDGWIGGGNEA